MLAAATTSSRGRVDLHSLLQATAASTAAASSLRSVFAFKIKTGSATHALFLHKIHIGMQIQLFRSPRPWHDESPPATAARRALTALDTSSTALDARTQGALCARQ